MSRTAAYRLSDAELAVFTAGVSSMGLEILAGRIVAPEFGSSIYTWGSIIGVFLAALSLGYALGGRRASEDASGSAIVRLLASAALFVAFLLVAADGVLQIADALPVPGRFAPLLPVAVLFGPPTFLLGFISPYAAELSADRSTGSASGRVYAVGTVGSIVGAFATTFFLVPSFGVATIELGFGVLLLAAAVKLVPGSDAVGWARILVAAVVLVASMTVATYGLTAGEDTLYQTQTEYQELRVGQDGDVRTLYLDGTRHSAMDVNDPDRHVFTYTRYFHMPMLMQDDVDRVLFIGGGGFTGPKHFVREYNVTVDVVEIDPGVVRAAKEHFRVNESDRLNVHVTDGRQFLEETDHTYDLIVLDAYRSDQVPFHLTTLEFMRLANSHLDDDGVLLANVISAESGSGSAFFRSEFKTVDRAFPHVYAFPTVDTPFLQNIELVATKRDEPFSQADLLRLNRQRDIGVNLSAEIRNYQNASMVATDDVPVLRDDRAPVEELLDDQLGRRYVVSQSNESTNATESVTPPAVGVPAAASVRG